MQSDTPARAPWGDFPEVLIHANEQAVKRHPQYAAAKAGDNQAARQLVEELLNITLVDTIRRVLAGRKPSLTPIHAVEAAGINKIPAAMAERMAFALGLSVWSDIVQINRVGHTGASGYHRLAHQALFDGSVEAHRDYLIVDDFIGMGGTVANLRGHIERHGGRVLLATALTGRPYSAILTPSQDTLHRLRGKHGPDLERWWHARFGHGYDALTQSEARYLERSPDADTIRDRILAAGS